MWQEVKKERLGVERVALGVERVALGVERVALGVERVALGVERVALGVERVTLGVERVALGVERVALGVERVALGVERIEDNIYSSFVLYVSITVCGKVMSSGRYSGSCHSKVISIVLARGLLEVQRSLFKRVMSFLIRLRIPPVWRGGTCLIAHSHCKAAILSGKPWRMHMCFHPGPLLVVYFAPPFISPLWQRSRLWALLDAPQ